MIENIYSELKVGDTGFIEKTITETDVYIYAGITGDFSWLHINEMRAKRGHFKTRIAHGMLLAGLVSNVVGNQMPEQDHIQPKHEIYSPLLYKRYYPS